MIKQRHWCYRPEKEEGLAVSSLSRPVATIVVKTIPQGGFSIAQSKRMLSMFVSAFSEAACHWQYVPFFHEGSELGTGKVAAPAQHLNKGSGPMNTVATDKNAKEALQVTKEIVVKFIETSRVSPSNFSEIFPSVYRVVLETITKSGNMPTQHASRNHGEPHE